MPKPFIGNVSKYSKVFYDSGSSFKSYKVDGTSVENILGAASSHVPSITNFTFYYLPSGNGEVELDATGLVINSYSNKSLVYINLSNTDNFSIVSGITWLNTIPVFEPGNQYLFYLYLNNNNQVNGELLYSTNQTVISIKLKFNIEGDNLTLDLTPAFPESISGYRVNYNATVDWGDGTNNKISTSNTSHTYDSAGEKTIQISGICQGLGTLPSSLTEVVELSGVSLFQKTFLYCNQLTSIPGSILNHAKLQDNFDYLFQGTSLTSIPEELFNECTQVKRLKGTFAETDIEEIPVRLFKNLRNLSNLTSCFDSCSNLESLPEGLFDNTPILSNIEGIFQATRIGTIDNTIFNKTRVTDFERALSVDLSFINSDERIEEAIEKAQEAKDAVEEHIADKENPHEVSIDQVIGADKLVEHITDYNNPHKVDYSQLTGTEAVQTHLANKNNPHEVKIDQVSGADVLVDHLTDTNNPHRVDYSQLTGKDAVDEHLTNYNNPHKVDFEQLTGTEDVINHLSDTNNPHNVTIQQIGGSEELLTHVTDYNNPHKVKLEQLGIENLPLTDDVTMNGLWTINPGDSTNSAASLTLEMGYSASWTGTITWKSKSGYKDPERVSGLITNVGSSGTAQSVTIPSKSSNYTGTITFYAKKTGLTVNGSNVVIASGQEDSRSYSRSVSFQKRYYFGYSLDDSLDEDGIKALEKQALSTTRARSFSAQTSGLEYVYYAYPTSWGAVAQIYVGGYGALEAFNRSTITISPVSGYNEALYVYRSTLPGMYENSLTIQFT